MISLCDLRWVLIALIWCTLVSVSRIYLGVHSFADIYMGLIVGLLLLVPVLPLAEYSGTIHL